VSLLRRFTLLDAMILIAAMGLGMLLWKDYLRCGSALPYLVSEEHGPSRWKFWVQFRGLVPGLSVVTLALLPLRLMAPRPRLRRAFLSPGTTPSLVVILALGVVLAQFVLDRPAIRHTHFPQIGVLGPGELLTLRLVGMKGMVGPGVAFAWGLLWLGGGWRPEATWPDRAGRIVGITWVALGLASWTIGLLD
jgi:hypothetical protein